MLNALREGTTNYIAKGFIGVLILSFAAWGIGDLFVDYGRSVLATVGDRPVYVDVFEREFETQSERMSALFNRNLGGDEAEDRLLRQRTLQILLDRAALEQAAEDMGLVASDAMLREALAEATIFHNIAGRFDRDRFYRYLQGSGLSEEAYLNQLRDQLKTRQLAAGLGEAMKVPDVMVDALMRHRRERRVIDYVLIPIAAAGEEPTIADEATARAFYEDHASLFTAPEYRRFDVLRIDPADLVDADPVSEDDLRAFYQSQLSRYTEPERRRLAQLSFTTREAAEAALARIRGGEDFFAVAAENGISREQADLGEVTRSELLLPQLADLAFALQAGETGGVVETAFAFSLIYVEDATPGRVVSFQEARDDLLYQRRHELGLDLVVETYENIEDRLAGGEALADVAASFGIPLRRTPPLDMEGRSPGIDLDGGHGDDRLDDLKPEQRAQIVQAAFERDIDDDAAALEFADDTLVWVDVTAVRPSGALPFEKIVDRVKERRRRSLLAQTALDEAKRRAAVGASSLERAAADFDVRIVETAPILRGESASTPFAPTALRRLFDLGIDAAFAGTAVGDDAVFIARIAEIEAPAPHPDQPEWKQMQAELSDAVGAEMIAHALGLLKERYGVEINSEIWRGLNGEADENAL